ncbi:flavin reductase [Micromonospora sp. NBC_00617]|uniref:flavin reductase n=1 Tax=Micromonospora sp. NBC_00617 TaxID=2903587 RepID=UPI0030E4E326
MPHTEGKARKSTHSPLRPSWRCPVCGILWPCSAAKLRLLGEYREDRPGLLSHLATVQQQAETDLTALNPDVALPDLTPRFVGWAQAR